MTNPKIYARVRDYLKGIPSEKLASLRIYMMTPEYIDNLRKQLKQSLAPIYLDNINKTGRVHKNQIWCYCFVYGEEELNELMKQII